MNKFFSVVFLLVFLLVPGQLLADQSVRVEGSSSPLAHKITTPNLADIIPMATALSVRFVRLENDLKSTLDVASIEKKYALIVGDLDSLSSQLKKLQQKRIHPSQQGIDFTSLKRIIQNKKLQLRQLSRPLKGEIRRFDSWRLEWLAEKGHWDDWKVSLLKGREIEQLKLTFTNVDSTINTALVQVQNQLEAVLAVQLKISTALGQLDLLAIDLISDAQQSRPNNQSPSIFSFEFFSQFTDDNPFIALWDGLRLAINLKGYSIALHGWNLLLQVLFFLFVRTIIHRNRVGLSHSESWKFLSERPVSVSLFIVTLLTILLTYYSSDREVLKAVYFIVGGVSCVRILGKVVKPLWQRQVLYGVMITFVLNTILLQIGFPQPLFRVYIFLVCIIALYFFSRWNKDVSSQNKAGFYFWLLRLGCGFVLIIILAEIFGKAELSRYLFMSITDSFASTFPYLLLMYLIHGGLNWVFFSSPIWKIKLLRSDARYLVRKVSVLIFVPIVLFAILPGILASWGVYDSISAATAGFLSLGFYAGTMWVSVAMILASIMVFYAALLTSHVLPKVLLDEVVTGRKLQRGVQNSIGKLIRYSIVLIGFLFAFMALGFDFTKLTIIMGALGVGIGFGLQGIVNNFVSGLILLFERPLREGDTVELEGKSARIKKIGLRATIVETFDQADVIIPNADLINNRVTNWTLANRQVRLSIPVGVAYGSDVSLVVETLLTCAKRQETVAKTPAPHVLFTNFGKSSLDFELRVWIPDADTRLGVKSDLYHDIERAFRETNIEIPFPQMDLHFRQSGGVDKIISPTPE